MKLPFGNMNKHFEAEFKEALGRSWHTDMMSELSALILQNTTLPFGRVYPFDLKDLRWLKVHIDEYSFSDTPRLLWLIDFELAFYEADSMQYYYSSEEEYNNETGEIIQTEQFRPRRSRSITLIKFGELDFDGDTWCRSTLEPYLKPNDYYPITWGAPAINGEDTEYIGVATAATLSDDKLTVKLWFHGNNGEAIFLNPAKYRFVPYGQGQMGLSGKGIDKFILKSISAIKVDPLDAFTIEQEAIYRSEDKFIRDVFFNNVAKSLKKVYHG